jgi:DNA-binding CsgD family transcriptional regulator/tetratricopeptide (TPR) repeat protein
MELLERASQLQALNSALSQVKAREGQGCVALVYGEAGIGKTSLVEHFLKEHKTKWRILQGACDSLFTPRPLGPLHDIALQLSSPQGTQGQLLRLLDSESKRTAIFSACLNELKEQATILVIEDVHWADEATLDLLKYLGRRIRQTISLMILTYRDDEIGADHPLRILLGDLASSHALHRIPVTYLSKDAVHELAKNKKVDSVELHRLTNGNPFYVTEVLAVESGIPETVRDAVLARAARLSAAARGVLEAAAVIGSRAEAWLLSNVVGAEFIHVEECVAKGMLQSQGEYYAFRHELARQTILVSISPQRKIELHRLALNELEGLSVTRENLARLVHHAEELNDSQSVLLFAPLAARWASALGAHRQASVHYRTALQYANVLPAEGRAELLDGYSTECDFTDQMIEAMHAQQEALRLWQELGRREKEGRALRRLSEISYKQYQKLEMERYSVEAITILQDLPPSKELAMAYSQKSRLHLVAEQYDETIHWGTRAVELAERLGDVETLAHALNNIGLQELRRGHRTEGQAKLEHSLQLGLTNEYHDHAARSFCNLIDTLMTLHDYPTSLRIADKGIAYCAQHDLDFWHVILSGLRAQIQFEQGQWSGAERDISTADKLWNEPMEEVLRPRLWLQVRRGDPNLSETLEAGRKLAQTSFLFEFGCNIAAILAEEAWLRGDLVQCCAEARSVFETARQRNVPDAIGKLAYWMWRADALIEPLANAIDPYSAQISGDWKTAALMWEEYGCPYEQGMALMDGDEAAQLKALEIFERLGARPIIEILKRQMRAQGIRIPRGPRPATRENPLGLTAREMEVLSCVVKGLSNNAIGKKLSLSTRTVEHHIASILQKMGVQSRNEAVALALKEKLFTLG